MPRASRGITTEQPRFTLTGVNVIGSTQQEGLLQSLLQVPLKLDFEICKLSPRLRSVPLRR